LTTPEAAIAGVSEVNFASVVVAVVDELVFAGIIAAAVVRVASEPPATLAVEAAAVDAAESVEVAALAEDMTDKPALVQLMAPVAMDATAEVGATDVAPLEEPPELHPTSDIRRPQRTEVNQGAGAIHDERGANPSP
jgi:hypothetical protein